MRSAEPASSQGTCAAIAFSTLLEALRVAMPFSSGSKLGMLRVPAVRQLAALHRLDLRRRAPARRPVGLEQPLPLGAQLGAALADHLGEVLLDPVGDEELRVLGPAVEALGLPDLLLAERLAVGLGRVLLVRRAVADVAVDDDQRRPLLLVLELVEGAGDQLEVVGVADPGDVPAVALKRAATSSV